MILNSNTHLTDEQIDALEGIGFNRWTKYGKDRLYITYKVLGLEFDFYKTGNISSAKLDGEKISNYQANKLRGQLGQSYIDIETGALGGTIYGRAKELVCEAIKNL